MIILLFFLLSTVAYVLIGVVYLMIIYLPNYLHTYLPTHNNRSFCRCICPSTRIEFLSRMTWSLKFQTLPRDLMSDYPPPFLWPVFFFNLARDTISDLICDLPTLFSDLICDSPTLFSDLICIFPCDLKPDFSARDLTWDLPNLSSNLNHFDPWHFISDFYVWPDLWFSTPFPMTRSVIFQPFCRPVP